MTGCSGRCYDSRPPSRSHKGKFSIVEVFIAGFLNTRQGVGKPSAEGQVLKGRTVCCKDFSELDGHAINMKI